MNLPLSHWSDGTFDFDEAEKAGEEVRAAFAAIIGAEPREVALVPNVSTAAGMDSSLAWFPAMAERACIGVIQRFGLNKIIDRNSHLTQYLYEKLAGAGMAWKPFNPENRSNIVSVPVIDPDGVIGRLRDANVVASVRAGAVRLSAHFYNLEEEIDRVVEIIVDFKQDQ